MQGAVLPFKQLGIQRDETLYPDVYTMGPPSHDTSHTTHQGFAADDSQTQWLNLGFSTLPLIIQLPYCLT
jgi:hypothetical protein